MRNVGGGGPTVCANTGTKDSMVYFCSRFADESPRLGKKPLVVWNYGASRC